MTSPLMPDAGPNEARVDPADDASAAPLGEAVPAAVVPPVPATPPAPPAPPKAVKFPLGWLLDHASYPIQYRAITEVARLGHVLPPKAHDIPLAHRPALALAMGQRPDGTWNDAMLTVPPAGSDSMAGAGTVHAARRLVEYGWDKDTPPLACTRRTLFRLLAEDENPEYLYEFAGDAGSDDMVRRGRGILREAAAAALAQAGYEADPRLRGAARRIIDRVAAYIRSPASQKPFVRFGNQHALPPEAAPPSIYTLQMLAYMPLFRHEHYEAMERIYDQITHQAPKTETMQMVGTDLVAQPHLVLGDPLTTRNAGDADIPFAMHWLELMARLGFLKRNDGWLKIYDRYLDCLDSHGIFRTSKGMVLTSENPHTWHMYPLDDRAEPGVVDVTFRLGLIGRLIGRQIDVV